MKIILVQNVAWLDVSLMKGIKIWGIMQALLQNYYSLIFAFKKSNANLSV